MPDVIFEDFTVKVKAELNNRLIIALETAAATLLKGAQDNTRNDTGETRQGWKKHIEHSELTAYIGNIKENAIWEEFGTGEYAAETGHTGRAGYWVYVKNSSGEGKPDRPLNKTYTLEEAKRIMAILRSKGLEAYYTKGKRPSRALYKAFKAKKKTVEKIFQDELGGMK